MASPDHKVGWLRTNQGVATCLSLIFVGLLGFLLSQDWVFQQQRDGFRLGFFTLVSAGTMLVCSVFAMFGRQKSDTTPEMAKILPKHWLRALIALAVMGVYYILAWDAHFSQEWLRSILDIIPFTGDFLLWTMAFLTLGMMVLGVRPISSAIVAGLIVSIIIFWLFLAIGIDLPRALVGQIIGGA